MNKYIDVDKLKAEIERRKDIYIGHALCLKETNLIDGFDEALNIIESLQQEPRFPQYDNIVEKVFGAGNLEGWERDEAEMLVALAKEELLKSLQQEQPEVDLEKIKNLIRAALNGVTRLGSLCDDQTIEHAVDNLIDKLGLNARKEE